MSWMLMVVAALSADGAETPEVVPPCPAAGSLPLLSIGEIEDPAVPVTDRWQVFWGHVPLSDAQVAQLSGAEPLIERTRAEMADRGTWVYVGMGLAALGTAASSTGWVLYGQNEVPQGITIPLAAGGILLGIVGVLVVTDSIQTPLEPHLAPTPVHRMTKDELHELVVRINGELYRDLCAGLPPSGPPTPEPETHRDPRDPRQWDPLESTCRHASLSIL